MLSISLTEADKDRLVVKAGENIDMPVSLNVGYDCDPLRSSSPVLGSIAIFIMISCTISPSNGGVANTFIQLSDATQS